MVERDKFGRFFKGCDSPRKGQKYPQGERCIEKECEVCHNHFFVNKCHSFARFCSRKCAKKDYVLNNLQKVREYKHQNYRDNVSLHRGIIYDKHTGKKIGICLNCGKTFFGLAHKEYCSHRCWANKFRNENRVEIRKLHIIYSKTDNFRHQDRKQIRKYNYDNHKKLILAIFGTKCVLCSNPYKAIHHRKYSGDWKDCIPVCYVCHGIMNSYQHSAREDGVET